MAPIINNFSPSTAASGAVVTITGEHFTGTTDVQFGGISALLFMIDSDQQIRAWVPLYGTGTLTIVHPDGNATVPGFSQVLSRVKLPDLPPLQRDANADDLVYIWDVLASQLKYARVDQLPAGQGSGGGGTVYTALGSPFKVYGYQDEYSYDPVNNIVTITDLRLIGKSGYVVYASDLSSELSDWDAGTQSGYLEYNEVDGILTIHNYRLVDGYHITIYCDGVVSTELQNYLLSIRNKINTYDKVVAPVIATKGVIFVWRKPAIEIPAGWQECTDFRGKTLFGFSPTDDDFDEIDGTGGAKNVKMTEAMLKYHTHSYRTPGFNGSAGDRLESDQLKRDDDIGLYRKGTDATGGAGQVDPTPIPLLNPYRIVMFIEYVG